MFLLRNWRNECLRSRISTYGMWLTEILRLQFTILPLLSGQSGHLVFILPLSLTIIVLLILNKIFPLSYWFSCLQMSFLCTQKSVTKRSSYSEFVKMCLKKQRRRKKIELKPRLNLSEPKELQWLKVRKFKFITWDDEFGSHIIIA